MYGIQLIWSAALQIPPCRRMQGSNPGLFPLWLDWQTDALTTRLDLIHTWFLAISHSHSTRSHSHSARSLPQSARSHPHSARSHPHSARTHSHMLILQGISQTLHMDDEINLAAKTGELTAKLKMLYKALCSIPAASIESERAFSVAGGFATKIRSQLSDKTLDRFLFAKCYFKNQDLLLAVSIVISWIFLHSFTLAQNLPYKRIVLTNSIILHCII